MVNVRNYNQIMRQPSVHYGRTNIWNRYHMNASIKASRVPMGGDSIFIMGPPQPHCCHSHGNNTLRTIFAGLFGFSSGFGLTSGQNQGMGGMPGMGGFGGGFGGWFGGGFGNFFG